MGFPQTTVVVLRSWYQSDRYGRGSSHGEVTCPPTLTCSAMAEIREPFQGVGPQHVAEWADKTNAITVTALNVNYDEMFPHTSIIVGVFVSHHTRIFLQTSGYLHRGAPSESTVDGS